VAAPDAIRIVDVLDRAGFDRLPPCADPRFDHRSCDYWEDPVRGSKAARASWWQGDPPPRPGGQLRADIAGNPFAPPADEPAFNPFAPTAGAAAFEPFDPLGDGDDEPIDNPFAPRRHPPSPSSDGDPRKLALLLRGQASSGSYAKVLELDGEPVAYAQFGPLSAYPRARDIRDLYPQLPQSPLPAVFSCIASTPHARGRGFARALVRAVCDDLGMRGFSAVEAYPDQTLGADEASSAFPSFWMGCGFWMAVEDERFPVMRLELA
jgi:GNAT superfamily N-acetyltransferase